MKYILRILLSALIILPCTGRVDAQGKKALGLTDLMKFRHIQSPSISNDGKWVAHTSKPDRGDPEVLVYSTNGKKTFVIPRGEKPVLSNDGKWVAAVQAVPVEVQLRPEPARDEKKPEAGMVLLNTSTGEQTVYGNVQSFRFSNDSRWLLYRNTIKEPEEDGKKGGRKNTGSTLNLFSLENETAMDFPFVTEFAVDSISRFLAFAVSDSNGNGNGVFVVDLDSPEGEYESIYGDSCAWAAGFGWNNRNGKLAFLAGITDEKEKSREAELYLWSPGEAAAEAVLGDGDLAGDWHIYHKNTLTWSLDGKRLFLGIKPGSEILPPEEEKDTVPHVFDTAAILADRTLDVWHWNDPYINPNQKKRWERIKDRTYAGVYDLAGDRFTALADEALPEVEIRENCPLLLAHTNLPYAKRVTWDGQYLDVYLVDVETGERKLVAKEQQHSVSLSPDGKYLVYYRAGNWYLVTASTLESRNLTGELEVPFADEDWDRPGDAPGYGIGGWIDGSEGVLIYDKYDIWQFPTSGGEPVCLTQGQGRRGKYQFRVRRLDRSKDYLESGKQVLLTAYHEMEKHTAVYSMVTGVPGLTRLAEEPKKYSLLAKARDADRVLFTRESYTEFPDLWVTDMNFKKPRRLSDANPQIAEFAWGEAELVEWSTPDSIPLQGVLIKPGNCVPGKKYPVLVYYYSIFSNRLHEFNEVVVNHRPCFPYYASNGYAVFLPDIRFDVGSPGYSAIKCLVPGVQKIIDMGIADPDAVCLHGYSWSGYQTAFVITQTDIFTCAIAGAPVSNMTSAYSGIRWESGLARQMQYEKEQSRIGASLWEARDRYIENSPVFYADRINTPLLIQFGDEDGAVPWYQGIELYLAMRRLGKDCIFLQYRGEPHHLKQYANKLDYTIRFRQYLDHYLKGEPAPEWITSGVPYRGK